MSKARGAASRLFADAAQTENAESAAMDFPAEQVTRIVVQKVRARA